MGGEVLNYAMGMMHGRGAFYLGFKIDEDYYEAWTLQGICLLARAKATLPANRRSAANDLREARRRLKCALSIRPGYAPASKAMGDVDGALRRLGR